MGIIASQHPTAVLAQTIADQLDVHPDQAIFTSLPRSGNVRAARLLAEIRDARGRFPTRDWRAYRISDTGPYENGR